MGFGGWQEANGTLKTLINSVSEKKLYLETESLSDKTINIIEPSRSAFFSFVINTWLVCTPLSPPTPFYHLLKNRTTQPRPTSSWPVTKRPYINSVNRLPSFYIYRDLYTERAAAVSKTCTTTFIFNIYFLFAKVLCWASLSPNLTHCLWEKL